MLIKITQSCSMGCSHCMNNCVPSDNHMTMKVFKDVLDFIQKYDSNSFFGDMITGGEPTENPIIWDLVDEYFKVFKNKPLNILTNGLYLMENQILVSEKLDEYPFLFFQVTNDTRYYPKKLDLTKRIFRHKRVVVVSELDHIVPIGRALINHPEERGQKNKCPVCVNVKIVALQTYPQTLKNIISNLRKNNKNCIPSIQYNGDIAFGEYDSCPPYVSIYSSESDIVSSILNFKCDRCPILMDKFKNNMDKLLPGSFIAKYYDNFF